MLELVVLVLDGAFQPVRAVEIHDDAALVEALMALCEVGLHYEAEELLAGLHLQYGGIVVLEVIVGALPQVGMRSGGNENGVALHLVAFGLPCPLEFV